jgi:hypothetical protein
MVPIAWSDYLSGVAGESFREDSARISELVFEYSARIDSGDLAGLADLLGDAGFGTLEGPLLHGRDRILALYEATVRIYSDGTPKTKHLVTNLVIDIDDRRAEGGELRTAKARSYFTVLQSPQVGTLAPIVAGRYHDRFALTDRGWRFTERRIATDLVGDVSEHMLPAAQHLLTDTDSR